MTTCARSTFRSLRVPQHERRPHPVTGRARLARTPQGGRRAQATYLNLKQHGDGGEHLSLPRRKFDHDQTNNLLARSMNQIAGTLTRDYGGCISPLRRTLHGLDIIMTSTGLKYYRERVWWSAV